jgi:hypothetical protein
MIRRLIFPCFALLAGCEMQQFGTFSREVDIEGGQTITVGFAHGMPVPTEDDDVRVIIASLRPAGKDLFQLFSFVVKNGQLPQRVTVEDVAGDRPELFVDDRNPSFFVDPKKPDAKSNIWAWHSPPLTSIHWEPAWLHEGDDSVRVYRFTIIMHDGRKLVEYQAARYTFGIKQLILKTLGTDAPKRDNTVEQIQM